MDIRLLRGRVTISRERFTAGPVTVGSTTVMPEGRVTRVRTPVGGFIHMRPTAVLVRLGGRTERIPIRNITCLLRAATVILGFVAPVARHTADHAKE